MFENILDKIGILSPTVEEMKQLNAFLKDAEDMVRVYIGSPIIPVELQWMCEDIAIKKFRMVGSEHLTSESIDGISFNYADVLEPYKVTLDRYASAYGRKLRFL